MTTHDVFFDELCDLTADDREIADRYYILSRLYHRFIDTATADCGLALIGAFAKTDYLLKEHGATPQLTRAVNDARVRLRNPAENPTAANLAADISAVARFVALVSGVEAPAGLIGNAGSNPDEAPAGLLMTDCLRITADRIDDDYIYGRTQSSDTEPVTVAWRECGRNYPYDRSYLASLITPGDQLNLIMPRRRDDSVITADLIIYQPDYLINISQIASCFETYTTSPVVSLLKKISPAPNTEAVTLGNFASQLLDEAVHSAGHDIPYPDSIREFFGRNALSLASCDISRSFHDEARRQHDNIRKALGHDLVDAVSTYDPRQVILEPSFYSERLGLQGRMDLLSLDYTLLIEQKAGKGEWPQNFAGQPRQSVTHHVQLLLYITLLRYTFPDRYRQLQAMLLYSRYAEPLLAPGFAPRLVFEALKVRNQIVAQEFEFTRSGFASLETLDIDRLNTNGPSVLWQRYTRPQLNELLQPLHDASPLELAYYRRMTRFVATEHMLSKIGNASKQASGLAAVWQSPVSEKLDAGNICIGLTMLSPDPGSREPVDEIEMLRGERQHMTDFREGDIVILYPYAPDSSPDALRDMLFRCSIRKITDDRILLDLRCRQSSAAPFARWHDCLWAMEHDFMESSYSSIYRGLHALLSAPAARRDLLMLRRRPSVDQSRTLRNDYGEFNELVLRTRQADDLFLIIGPPGTGKTSFGLMNTLREALTDPGASVLLMAYTNRAVDEICSKLVDAGIDFLRIGSETACDRAYIDSLIDRRAQSCATVDAVRRMIADQRVFAGTVASVSARISLFEIKSFDLAIIDEASQILEPHLAGLLAATNNGRPAIGKIVMIGDHKQLPAVVQQRPAQSRVNEPELQQIGLTDCRNSLFERLLRHYSDDDSVRYMLCRQGRMHHDIADFPNKVFYDGRLTEALIQQTAPLPQTVYADRLTNAVCSSRVVFINVTADDLCRDKSNPAEARVITDIVSRIVGLHPECDPREIIGIIVPYRNQISAIRSQLTQLAVPGCDDITIDTVERFQGSQRRYIIYGFTVSRPYQLDFLTENIFEQDGIEIDRKLNVAMTRAQDHLILVGDASLLSAVPLFDRLIAYNRERSAYYDIDDLG
ncbi:MAG: AAA domain-containing protein [Bacteroidales bacterium]|nr:AAA domain-containing protein [Bacteroidales bacterium]